MGCYIKLLCIVTKIKIVVVWLVTSNETIFKCRSMNYHASVLKLINQN